MARIIDKKIVDGELKYAFVKEFIPVEVAEAMASYIEAQASAGKLGKDNQCPNSFRIAARFNRLQVQLRPLMERLFNENSSGEHVDLISTYNYGRQYVNGEILKRHRDRPACDYSATVSLGKREGDAWPFYAQYKKHEQLEVSMDVGDAVIYRGHQVDHWRESNTQGLQYQVFFHYVDKNGPHKEWKFNKKREKFRARKLSGPDIKL